MDQLTATTAKEKFLNLLQNVTQNNQQYQIKDDHGFAVLISQKDYENLLETIELLSIPGFRDSLSKSVQQIAVGEIYSLDEVLGDI